MSQSPRLNRVLEGIDANLADLHHARWTKDHIALRDRVRQTDGAEKVEAREALAAHYATRNHPETSRDFFVQGAMQRNGTK